MRLLPHLNSKPEQLNLVPEKSKSQHQGVVVIVFRLTNTDENRFNTKLSFSGRRLARKQSQVSWGSLYFVPSFPDALDWVVKVWVSFNQLTSPPGICCKSVLICRCYVYVRLQQSVLPNSRPRHTGLLAKSGCSSFPALSKLSFFFMRCFFAYPALSFNFLNVASAFVFFMLGL